MYCYFWCGIEIGQLVKRSYQFTLYIFKIYLKGIFDCVNYYGWKRGLANSPKSRVGKKAAGQGWEYGVKFKTAQIIKCAMKRTYKPSKFKGLRELELAPKEKEKRNMLLLRMEECRIIFNITLGKIKFSD